MIVFRVTLNSLISMVTHYDGSYSVIHGWRNEALCQILSYLPTQGLTFLVGWYDKLVWHIQSVRFLLERATRHTL